MRSSAAVLGRLGLAVASVAAFAYFLASSNFLPDVAVSPGGRRCAAGPCLPHETKAWPYFYYLGQQYCSTPAPVLIQLRWHAGCRQLTRYRLATSTGLTVTQWQSSCQCWWVQSYQSLTSAAHTFSCSHKDTSAPPAATSPAHWQSFPQQWLGPQNHCQQRGCHNTA